MLPESEVTDMLHDAFIRIDREVQQSWLPVRTTLQHFYSQLRDATGELVSQVAQLQEANAALARNNESLLREIETLHLTIDPDYLAQASETQSSPTSTVGLERVGPTLRPRNGRNRPRQVLPKIPEVGPGEPVKATESLEQSNVSLRRP
ncbi:hypothetical protein EJ05DRAFT_481199 [Pseudovirgaria hyperparasitica]|uniref:Uncharacterized protein n=1 Tax=Pseudovirgaria hyperparasitica TaxID=470096 RepID=A0A6A6VQT0_9PEZI|nr:uncharacterized protein EJ05DRAFT_481199 [Pseudovirgaria hyperparasitica]KAF2752553.1 hypothetical protein EJ05DRAFT_481199 [Pseudovirgaria hyperparasitica]